MMYNSGSVKKAEVQAMESEMLRFSPIVSAMYKIRNQQIRGQVRLSRLEIKCEVR